MSEETFGNKKKDTNLLGDGKPAVTSLARTFRLEEMRWRVAILVVLVSLR